MNETRTQKAVRKALAREQGEWAELAIALADELLSWYGEWTEQLSGWGTVIHKARAIKAKQSK